MRPVRRAPGRARLLAERSVTRGPSVYALRRRWGITPLWLIAVAVVVFVLTALDVLNSGALTSFDHAVSRHVLGWHVRDVGWRKDLVYLLTFFGQRGPVLIVTAPLVVISCWRARSLDLAVRYLIGLVVLTVVVYAVKDAIGRTAPPVDELHTASGQSFPSGHLATAVLVWWLLWWHWRAASPAATLTRVLAVVRFAGPVCVIVGMSLLDYHWSSDFVAGACIGIVALGLVTHPVLTRLARWPNRRIWPA